MDYEKKYKDALSVAKGIHSYSSDIAEIKRMEQIFPELTESEDERIRKEIISALKYANHEGVYNKHLAWLEKQGQKPQNKTTFETTKEENADNTNKVGLKFKIGDWIVRQSSKGKTIAQILDIQEQYYVGLDIDGNDFTSSRFLSDDKIHLWTIADAKDGDVLINSSNIFIFSHFSSTRAMGYCHINLDDGRFYDDKGKNECFGLIDAVFTPATKEQCDLLFSEMTEAGYEWDAEKKEVRKIEPKIAESEDEKISKEIIQYIKALNKDGYLYDEEWIAWLEKQGNTDETINRTEFAQAVLRGAAINLITWIDYNAAEGNMCLSNVQCKDIENALVRGNWDKIYDYMKKKLEKQALKTKWSEEDGKIYQTIIDDTVQENQLDSKQIDWLKSIKQRMEECI